MTCLEGCEGKGGEGEERAGGGEEGEKRSEGREGNGGDRESGTDRREKEH